MKAIRRWGDGRLTHDQGIECNWAEADKDYKPRFLGKWSSPPPVD